MIRYIESCITAIHSGDIVGQAVSRSTQRSTLNLIARAWYRQVAFGLLLQSAVIDAETPESTTATNTTDEGKPPNLSITQRLLGSCPFLFHWVGELRSRKEKSDTMERLHTGKSFYHSLRSWRTVPLTNRILILLHVTTKHWQKFVILVALDVEGRNQLLYVIGSSSCIYWIAFFFRSHIGNIWEQYMCNVLRQANRVNYSWGLPYYKQCLSVEELYDNETLFGHTANLDRQWKDSEWSIAQKK